MKKIIILSLILASSLFSQTLLLEENFDYSIGTLTMVTTNWTESPTGSTDIQIVNGSLSYANYVSSNTGNKITLNGGASGRSGTSRTFTSTSSAGTTVYWSFLMEVTDVIDLDSINGDYFANFQNSSTSVLRNLIYIKKGSISNSFNLGLAKTNQQTPTWVTNDFSLNTTYLIVVGYTFVSGSNNDISKLWINPSLSGDEPTSDISISSGADASDIGIIQFRQNSKSGDMNIDGIRVSDSWSQSPLPVQLTSFTANSFNNNVVLNWSTATEVNNYGFEVERTRYTSTSLSVTNWEKVGFVAGNGNSNSPKDYSFIDYNAPAGKLKYRLKQIDFDGTFEFSKAVDAYVESPKEFRLSQNYPNPFNPSTVINYQLPIDGNVTLKIYDILGNEITTLVNEFQKAGTYNYQLSINNLQLSSGVYYYRLQSGNFVQTKKLVIMK